MSNYPSHLNQIWVGYVPAQLPTGYMGEINPRFRRQLNMEYGRQLAGFGATEGDAGDSDYEAKTLSELEKQDDVVGSGVFDLPGHGATVHQTLGVFQDHPNLPGYIDREIPFRPSTEVVSEPSGAQVIVIPGGGMSYGGRLIGGGTSETMYNWLPKVGRPIPAPSATKMRPVATAKATASAPLPAARIAPVSSGRGKIAVAPATKKNFSADLTKSFLPARNTGSLAPVRAVAPGLPVVRSPAPTKAAAPARAPIVLRPRPVAAPLRGFGGDSDAPSVVPYLVSGALLGASIAIFKRYVIDKK